MAGALNRAALALILALFAFWAAGILGGAVKTVVSGMGPSPHPCKRCAVHWR